MLVMDGLELHLYPRMTLNFDHFPSTPQVLVPQVCALVTGLFGTGIGTRASCMLGKHCHLPRISSKAFNPSFNPVASKRTMDVTFGASQAWSPGYDNDPGSQWKPVATGGHSWFWFGQMALQRSLCFSKRPLPTCSLQTSQAVDRVCIGQGGFFRDCLSTDVPQIGST